MSLHHHTLSYPSPATGGPSLWTDELLLDIATVIELSDNDRAIADRRYGLLQRHLERPSSPLRDLVLADGAKIYAQGSMAIGATIVSGTEDDRFDVDAIVEIKVPSWWSDDEALDWLDEALQGFPGVRKIVRCTRCVQLQFAFMHMDVTILDPAREPRPERIGEIFHSPDDGPAYRVPSNPFGFSHWYRAAVTIINQGLIASLKKRRTELASDRLYEELAKADQENLPPVIPPRHDSQQVVALKLLKRFLNIRYCESALKRPPSIYVTKKSADCGYDANGLTSQLARLAGCIEQQMQEALITGLGPTEENPSYCPDKINDRWPVTQADRRGLIHEMRDLIQALDRARHSSAGDIKRIMVELFGERVSTRAYEVATARVPDRVAIGTGTVFVAATAIASPARAAPIPRHNFHCQDDTE